MKCKICKICDDHEYVMDGGNFGSMQVEQIVCDSCKKANIMDENQYKQQLQDEYNHENGLVQD